MNKSIKYLGFAFLGSLLFFTLGALRPFIASLNGLGVSTTLSNSVMVGTLRSMSGAVTNVDMPNSAPQHINFLPQTANTGEFDIGDPAQTTGRYLMFSKAAGAFVIGHDGTDALRLNVANGFITLPGGGLLGDTLGETFTLNTNAILQIDPLAQLLVNGDDPTAANRGEIFLHGTNAHIRLDVGAPIEDATAHTHLTMANGSASLDGTFNTTGSGGLGIDQTSSNGLGMVRLRPDFTMTSTQTLIWPTNPASPGQVLAVTSTNGLGTTNLQVALNWFYANSMPPVTVTGVGGANTNFTLQTTSEGYLIPEYIINGFTNVSIRGVMGYNTALVQYWNLSITNGSGSDRTLEFSAVTNSFRFAGTYGTNAPTTLTNNTRLMIAGRSVGTNTQIGYAYFAWP